MANNVAAALRFLKGKGLTATQAAAAVGAMTGESGPNLDPKARNPSSGALGIAQWLGGRKNAAVTSGDLGQQLNHLWHELNTSERGALSALKGSKNLDQAVRAWVDKFERPGPGEQTYGVRIAAAKRILQQHGGDAGTTSTTPMSGGKMTITGKVTPAGTEPSWREAAVMALQGGSHSIKGALKHSRLKAAKYYYDTGQAVETTPTKATETLSVTPPKAGTFDRTAQAAGSAAKGVFKVVGANPGRLSKGTVAFGREVAGVLGRPLTGDSGATHSKYTVDGNVSEHYSGHATDIPLKGDALTRAGQAALIAAGMDPAQARKTKGGLFTLRDKHGVRHQVIFNTNQGGNHFDHLHISSSA